MNHANRAGAKVAKPGNKGRAAFRDVSNFNAERSKQAKAAKSHKRSVSTIYSSSLPESKPANSKKSVSALTKSSVENDREDKSSVAVVMKAPKLKSNVQRKSPLGSSTSADVAEKAPLKPSQGKRPQAPKKVGAASSYQDGKALDIDKRDSYDPLYVTSYVKDMYEYYSEQEHRAVPTNYMENQQHINARMRSILVDWLCTVHHKMKCDPVTLYLTVNIIDRFLAEREVTKNKLQLVGVTSLLIASKYEQIYPVIVNDLVYVCNDLYTEDDVYEMEKQILTALNYQLSIPNAFNFFLRYMNANHADKTLVSLASFILEESLLSYDMIKYKPSQVAAAGVLLARKATGRTNWSPTLLKFSQYREEDIIPVARDMLAAKKVLPPGLDALKKKYRRARKLHAAGIPLPTNI